MNTLWQDIRFSLRMLRKSPGFTATVILMLGLGIGANSAIFSLVDAFMFRLLPVRDPHELVFINAMLPEGKSTNSFPYSAFEQLRDSNQSFSGMFAWDGTGGGKIVPVSVRVAGEPESVAGDFVSGGYFDVLGVSATVGRAFTANDDRPGQQLVAVISYDYWERRFSRDPETIGKTIYAGTIPFTVIGVTPRWFSGRDVVGKSADIILPMHIQPQIGLKDHKSFKIMARLKPGISIEQARADLEVIYKRVLTEAAGSQVSPDAEQGIRAQRIELKEAQRGFSEWDYYFDAEPHLLFTVVGIVLLIVCVNIANLFLARASARQSEVAVRLSLGASRARLIRQFLTESVLLALLGGALGLLFAIWGVNLLPGILSQNTFPVDLGVNLRILAFTGAVSLLTGALFGLAPALTATRVDLNSILKGNEGSTESRPARRRLTKSLVVAQVALSLALLIGAGLLVRTLEQLHEVDTGFARNNVLTMWAYPSSIGYEQAREMRLYRELLEKMSAIPGVQSAGLSRFSLTNGGRGSHLNLVDPRFFETVGIELVQGRVFSSTDTSDSPKVAVVSESMAQKYYPNQNAIEQRLPNEIAQNLGGDVQIVGVVRDSKNRLQQQAWNAAVYLPYTQAKNLGQIKFYIRTAGDPKSIIPALRTEVLSVEKDLPLQSVQTLAEELDAFVGREQAMATLISFFGALALCLAAIGMYGTMSYAVGRRTKELGIRMALGAGRKQILWMVLREALLLVMTGVAIGIPVALVSTRLIESLLFGVKTTDTTTITVAVLMMLAIAFLASYLPARRATKVDPMIALRHQ